MNFISLSELDEQDCWFQQYRATAHAANSTIQMLSVFFGGRIISRNLWPPWSPDLLPPNFCLWGVLKENVYKNNPHTLEELKQDIKLCISNVTAETLHRAASDMRKRVECIDRWTRSTFPTLNITLFFVFWFQCNLFFWQIEHVSGMGYVTFRASCIRCSSRLGNIIRLNCT
jgi:hypothetical protein